MKPHNSSRRDFLMASALAGLGATLAGCAAPGNHGLSIASVALLEDGREIAHDTHSGFTGARPNKPVYLLDLPMFKPGAKYTLQAYAAGDGETDSFGIVSWVFVSNDAKGKGQ